MLRLSSELRVRVCGMVWISLTCACFTLLLAASPASGAEYFVAPNGRSTNNGSQAQPLDLTTALSSASPARAGDTIWLRGGVYIGIYTSRLEGTPSAPITVRQYPGERATLDGVGSGTGNQRDVLTVLGSSTIFWGFEITNSDPGRLSNQTGPWPTDLPRGVGVSAYGRNLQFINLVIHDMRAGLGIWAESIDTVAYGNVVYHNGWSGPDRSHGHGIYTQNITGERMIRENIIFNQFSHGIHAYGSDVGPVDYITLEGNVSFNNGILGRTGFERDILLGGGRVAIDPVLNQNYTYGGANNNLGYGAGCINGRVTDNYLVDSTALILVNCTPTMVGNVFHGSYAAQYGFGWPISQYPNNTYYPQRPTTNYVRVRPNAFERGRAHVVIYNWTRQAQVSVDLSDSGLTIGETFEIRDAQSFFGAPVVTGIYVGAPVQIPMTGLTLARPLGNVPTQPAHTAPDFGVFVVLPSPTGDHTPETEIVGAPTISPGSGTYPGPVTVSIDTSTPGATIRYSTDGSIVSSASPIYTGSFVISGTGTVNARAFKTGLSDSAATTASFVVSAPSSPSVPTTPGAPTATASFLWTDGATKGTWQGVYGGAGYVLVNEGGGLPSFAEVTPTGHLSYTWAASTGDVRALQKARTTDRSATTWYTPSGNVFTIDLKLTDAQAHHVAVYAVDWDSQARQQRIEVLDATTGTILDQRDITGFNGGRYLVWRLSGQVRLRVTRVAGANAVVSAVFFDPVGTAPPRDLGAGASLPAAGPAATFLRADTTTQGTWQGSYGRTGYVLANDGSTIPGFAQVTPTGHLSYTWAASTTNQRALQKAGTTDRKAATWYTSVGSTIFTIDLKLTAAQPRQVAVYAVDWDSTSRQQRIEVLDAATGAVLDRREMTGFNAGRYLVWQLSGHVRLRVTRLGGTNAVVSAVFFD